MNFHAVTIWYHELCRLQSFKETALQDVLHYLKNLKIFHKFEITNQNIVICLHKYDTVLTRK